MLFRNAVHDRDGARRGDERDADRMNHERDP
jgi:hypothetical protein